MMLQQRVRSAALRSDDDFDRKRLTRVGTRVLRPLVKGGKTGAAQRLMRGRVARRARTTIETSETDSVLETKHRR